MYGLRRHGVAHRGTAQLGRHARKMSAHRAWYRKTRLRSHAMRSEEKRNNQHGHRWHARGIKSLIL